MTRKGFIALSLGGVAAALSTQDDAQLVEKSHDWSPTNLHGLMNRTARYRQVFDITQIGSDTFRNKIKDSFHGLPFSLGARPSGIQIVAALHGAANLLNFDDSMWAKYRLGELVNLKDPRTGEFATRNMFYPSTAVKPTVTPTTSNPFIGTRASRDCSQEGCAS